MDAKIDPQGVNIASDFTRVEVEALIDEVKNSSDQSASDENYPKLTEEDLAEYRRLRPLELIHRLDTAVFFQRRTTSDQIHSFMAELRSPVEKFEGAVGAQDLETEEYYSPEPGEDELLEEEEN